MKSLSVASAFSDALSNHENLKKLIFVLCGLYNTEILGIILEGCKTIRQLYIMLDNLGSQSVILLANFIRSNHSVEYLDLGENNLSNNDMVLLASALKTNTHLKQLFMIENNITEDGVNTLLKALYDPTSLDSIVESNHTCYYRIFDTDSAQRPPEPPLEAEVLVINRYSEFTNKDCSIQQKMRMKVVLALCGVEGELFDLFLLDDIPLQLMPHVLELIQEYSTSRYMQCDYDDLERDALSRLFHTLRGWELPSLFIHLNSPTASMTTGKRKRRNTRR